MIPNVCYLFFGLRGRLSKGKWKGIFGRARGREGNPFSFSPACARSCARIPLPFLFEGLQLRLSFSLIVYDVDVICVSVLYLDIIIER